MFCFILLPPFSRVSLLSFSISSSSSSSCFSSFSEFPPVLLIINIINIIFFYSSHMFSSSLLFLTLLFLCFSPSPLLVVPDLTVRTPIADQEPLIWTDPITIMLICLQQHPCWISPITPTRSSLSHFFSSQHTRLKCEIGKRHPPKIYEGTWISRFLNLGRIRMIRWCSTWSRPMQITPPPDRQSHCGFEGRSPLAEHTSRSPRQSRQAKDAPIRAQLSLSFILSVYLTPWNQARWLTCPF